MNAFISFLPVPPRDTIREFMEERGISQAALARDMGIPKEKVTQLLSDKEDEPISMEIAERLFRARMGPSPEFWIRCEEDYRRVLKERSHQKF